jgi:GH25 family lysozyme M1 (1,4-beta-N-acetylmuramidase)
MFSPTIMWVMIMIISPQNNTSYIGYYKTKEACVSAINQAYPFLNTRYNLEISYVCVPVENPPSK